MKWLMYALLIISLSSCFRNTEPISTERTVQKNTVSFVYSLDSGFLYDFDNHLVDYSDKYNLTDIENKIKEKLFPLLSNIDILDCFVSISYKEDERLFSWKNIPREEYQIIKEVNNFNVTSSTIRQKDWIIDFEFQDIIYENGTLVNFSLSYPNLVINLDFFLVNVAKKKIITLSEPT